MSKIGNQLKTALVLRSPRITEKSTALAERGGYVFVVDGRATKPSVKEAFVAKYKTVPVKINIVNLPAKTTFKRGIRGSKSGIKKAIVYLKAGDKIEVV
ncbi:MAG: 50S ribosomal protein L23 [Candidatus Vogelbacteria bacterium]|nr:50S ribosomal protein L23 [Candidatus Vogelbacteria bacterium]